MSGTGSAEKRSGRAAITKVLTGQVISGTRRAGFFMGLDWVKAQCEDKMGFRPYPGTLNVKIDPESAAVLEELRQECAVNLEPPEGSKFRPAWVHGVTVNGFCAAAVIPSSEVNVHPRDVLEVIAPVSLREALQLEDGSRIEVRFRLRDEARDEKYLGAG